MFGKIIKSSAVAIAAWQLSSCSLPGPNPNLQPGLEGSDIPAINPGVSKAGLIDSLNRMNEQQKFDIVQAMRSGEETAFRGFIVSKGSTGNLAISATITTIDGEQRVAFSTRTSKFYDPRKKPPGFIVER